MVFVADDADWSPLLQTKPTRPFSCTNRASGAGLGVQPSHVGLDRSSSQSALEASEAARRRRSCSPDRRQDIPSGQQLEHPERTSPGRVGHH